jgi:hypothetical protein
LQISGSAECSDPPDAIEVNLLMASMREFEKYGRRDHHGELRMENGDSQKCNTPAMLILMGA